MWTNLGTSGFDCVKGHSYCFPVLGKCWDEERFVWMMEKSIAGNSFFIFF